ncbi:hypothetical protein AC1031_001871 [Aphanomyces cochlioides]|nr:hypothetical protein AC1031_001871 [Aphanomyces cochlioides]
MRQLFRTPNDPSALDESNPSTEPKRYLRIVLDKATDLPVGDQALVGGASDPYIIFEFGEHRLRSTIVTHALNPSWRREQFEFVLTESEVQEHQKLRVTVLDYDLAKKDDLLGTFEIDMAAWQSSTTLGDMAIQPYDINVPDALAKQQVLTSLLRTLLDAILNRSIHSCISVLLCSLKWKRRQPSLCKFGSMRDGSPSKAGIATI